MKNNNTRQWLLMLLLGATAGQALATKITSEFVDDITLSGLPTVVNIDLKDMSGGNSLANINIQPTTQMLSFPVISTVKCAKSSAGYSHSRAGFGAFNPTFLDAGVIHQAENPQAGHTTWGSGQWITEGAATFQYQVPLASLKNPAKPELQLDPVAELNKAMASFVQQGGTELDFLRANRSIDVQRSISVLGACWKGFSDKGFATNTKPVTLRIRYEGKPALTNVNAQLGQMGGGGGFQAGYNPLTISAAQLQPHAPHYVGACPAELKFRVTMSGGGKGEVKYRIGGDSGTVYQSPALPFDGGGMQHDFVVALPAVPKWKLGDTEQRTFTVHIMAKDEKEAFFPSHYQHYGSKAWSYRCTPQVSVGVGGVGPGGAQLAPKPEPAAKPAILQYAPQPAAKPARLETKQPAPRPAKPVLPAAASEPMQPKAASPAAEPARVVPPTPKGIEARRAPIAASPARAVPPARTVPAPARVVPAE